MSEKSASRLKKLRREAGLTQHDLGKLLGVSTSQANRYEAHPERLTQAHLAKLARAFGLTVDDIVAAIGQDTTGPRLASSVRAVIIRTITAGMLCDTDQTAPFAWACSFHAMAIISPDTSMAPLVAPSDLVLIDPAIQPKAGSVVLAKLPVTGEHALRTFTPLHPTDPRAPGYTLRARDGVSPEVTASGQHDGEILGVATALQRRL